MLADNVLELVLHKVAETGASVSGMTVFRPYPGIDDAVWRKALGKNFDDKVRLAVKIGMVTDEVAITLRTCHEFRNELYHVGLQHEPILPTLARFHLHQVCEVLQAFETNHFSYSPGMQPPDRAKPYFTGNPFNVWDFLVQFRSACAQIASTSAHDTPAFVSALESHMEWTIDDVDRSLDTISGNGPRTTSRDEAVLQSQAWKIAFTDEGKRFAMENGAVTSTVLEYALWFAEHYPFPVRKDPMTSWRERLRRLAAEKNPHRALSMYRAFHSDTEAFRQVIDESAAAAEAWIDDQIARAREN